jgi:hypothetical protein
MKCLLIPNFSLIIKQIPIESLFSNKFLFVMLMKAKKNSKPFQLFGYNKHNKQKVAIK